MPRTTESLSRGDSRHPQRGRDRGVGAASRVDGLGVERALLRRERRAGHRPVAGHERRGGLRPGEARQGGRRGLAASVQAARAGARRPAAPRRSTRSGADRSRAPRRRRPPAGRSRSRRRPAGRTSAPPGPAAPAPRSTTGRPAARPRRRSRPASRWRPRPAADLAFQPVPRHTLQDRRPVRLVRPAGADQRQGDAVPVAEDRQRLEQPQVVLVRERHGRVEGEPLRQPERASDPREPPRGSGWSGATAGPRGITAIFWAGIPYCSTMSCFVQRVAVTTSAACSQPWRYRRPASATRPGRTAPGGGGAGGPTARRGTARWSRS